MNTDNINLIERIQVLESEIEAMKSASTLPLQIDQALQGRGFTKSAALSLLFSLSGIVRISGGNFSAISGVSGQFYAASTSGGSPTHLVTVTNGVITSIS